MTLAPGGQLVPDARSPAAAPEPDLGSALLAALLDGTSDAVVLTGPDGHVRWWNAPAGEVLPELAVGEPLTGVRAGPAGPADPDGGGPGRKHLEVHTRALADGFHAWYLRDVAVQRKREAELLAERSRLALLANAGRLLGSALNVERLLRTALDLLAEFGIPRCAVAVDHGDQNFLLAQVGSARAQRFSPSPVRAERGDRRQIRLTGRDRDENPLPGWAEPVDTFELRTFDAPFGTLIAEVPESADHDVLASFAEQLGSSLQAAVLHQRRGRHADTLRNSLTQRALPMIDGVQLAAAFRPAVERDRIGGDFYEVTATASGWSFALGDVCGKGVEAAVLSGQTRHVLHTASLLGIGPAARLDLLNRVIRAERTTRFVTLVTGDIAVRPDGGLLIRLANGGHPRPVVLDAGDREPWEVVEHGVLVGALGQARFTEVEVVLEPGGTMVLYTDGVTEARNPAGEFYGTDRLLRLLRECRGLPAAATTAYVEHDVFEFLRGAGHDDVAVLAIQAVLDSADEEDHR
ncbi:PP2C family protein-serine/threonine phosphatase [Saccharopolyspora sp. MS10]|uniref:PP2C family protein-serine/threonine phosphatase n=1 Tax=Saccharopolyspora sp. MS10 TaxID=3385973 RepID=UPI00399F409F